MFGHARQLRALRFGQLEISLRLCLYDRVVAQDPSGIGLDNLALCLASPFWPTHLVPWGKAKNLKEEFSVYGLPEWSFWAVGFSKVLLSLFLLAGLYFDPLVKPTALVLTLFMLAAVWMHLKMKRDSLVKALPAYLMLTACVFLVFD